MAELETGWQESKIGKYIESHLIHASYLEEITDLQGTVFYKSLGLAIKWGIFTDKTEEMSAIAMWEELHEIFGEES